MKARSEFQVTALTFNYGQKAAVREVAAAAKLTQYFQVPLKVVELPWFSEFTKTSLIGTMSIPVGAEVEIDSHERSLQTAEKVWVPNRNGIFLNIAAGFAEGMGAAQVIPGFNKEEAETFPDNSAAYLRSVEASWVFSTQGKVRTHCYSSDLTKTEIVAQARELGLPFHMLWPCYLDQKTWCGECESCHRFKRALQANGLSFEELRGKV